ncbi:MAG: hypothetical protein V4753_03650 [Pseudomonadota bacterium]
MALAGLKTMLAGALRDRVAALGVVVVAGVFLTTAWVLVVAALVAYLTPYLGTVGALLAVSAGLVVLSFLIVWISRMRNRRTAKLRATTRALWAATAVNAASAILRSDSRGPEAEQGGSHRSALLIAGGLALMLLAFLFPGGKGNPGDPPEPGPDGAA